MYLFVKKTSIINKWYKISDLLFAVMVILNTNVTNIFAQKKNIRTAAPCSRFASKHKPG